MSLETLVNRPGFPFNDFLANSQQYDHSREFWQSAFEEGIAARDTMSDWVHWMQNPFYDGLPIWSLINEKAWLGIAVQQVARSDDPVWFRCWLSEANIGCTRILPYLFVETFVSQSSYRIFAGLVKEWTENTSASTARLASITNRAQRHAIGNPPPVDEA